MEFKCEYCNGNYDDTLENCPHCGAQNNHIRRVADATPKTIEELKQWYIDRKLPPYEVTRFFIGVNYTQPRAFGIYEENGKYIVYKNKDTGERAIRYQGTDEAYAVNELYLKLKSEILNQKANQGKRKSTGGRCSSIKDRFPWIGITVAIVTVCSILMAIDGVMPAVLCGAGVTIALLAACAFIKNGKAFKVIKWWMFLIVFLVVTVISFIPFRRYYSPHYYMYNDTVYCNYRGDYYAYDSYAYDYHPVDYEYLPSTFVEHTTDYEYTWTNETWSDNYDFSSSDYYSDNFSSSSDSDSSYDWDSGSDSWDSGGSDWSSDWQLPTVGIDFKNKN